MLNRIVISGRLGKDCDLRYSPQGTAVGNFNLAVTRQFNREETDWINVVCFKKLAENTAQYTKKGSLVAVDGRLQTRTYEKDGQKRYITEVVADSIVFLESKGSSQSNSQTSSQPQQRANEYDPFSGGMSMSDDNLPFDL